MKCIFHFFKCISYSLIQLLHKWFTKFKVHGPYLCKKYFLLFLTCRYCVFLLNKPETIFIKASLSLCLGSMFAWILNTKPVNFFSSGFTSRVSDVFGLGSGAISTKQSSNSRTPKLFNAEPKNTGCNSPLRYSSWLNLG